MRFSHAAWVMFLCGCAIAAHAQTCDTKDWKPIEGVSLTVQPGGVELSWPGEHGQANRARFALREGKPVVEALAARKGAGAWVELGTNLSPDFEVTTGRRRISTTELDILKRLNNDTPEAEEQYKWNVFWDAPLEIPGTRFASGGAGRAQRTRWRTQRSATTPVLVAW